MKRLKKLWFWLAVVFGVLVMIAVAAWVYQPLNEWVGLSKRSFEKEARRPEMPTDASRIFSYDTGFTDSFTWTAFSASPESMERFLQDAFSIKLSDFEDWPDGSMPQLQLGNSWRFYGYWDIDYKAPMKVFRRVRGGERIEVFIDRQRGRLYLARVTG